jgi:hypothetical protein
VNKREINLKRVNILKPNLLRNMKWLLLLCFCLSSLLEAGLSGQSLIGKGWAKTSVNAVVFRKNSVITHDNTQFASYYDSLGFVVLAKRNVNENNWTIMRTPYQGNVLDAHNSISLMVDGEGFIHLAWAHHNTPLNYAVSIDPGSLQLTKKSGMTGAQEREITYPEFHRLPSGDLIFLYRSGESGRGNLIMNRYDVKLKKWFRVQEILIDGEGKRNAYWQFCTDVKGNFHLSWVWRETPDVASNHDVCYARSEDNGRTWMKSTGEKYQLPIKQANAEYATHIPQSRELINQTSMAVDERGNPYIATYWRDEDSSVPQYRVVFNDGKRWHQRQVGNRTLRFSLSGGGTKKIPISRPQIVVQKISDKTQAAIILRDQERESKVSMAVTSDLEKNDWRYYDVTDFSVGDWEPSFDSELWKSKKQLHLFVQRVGQGDGERSVDLQAQPVYIYPVTIRWAK